MLLHLAELRNRLLKSILLVLLFTLCLIPFANDLYYFLATPLLKQLPESHTMIATAVASPLLAPIKLTTFVAILLTTPFLLYQAWMFVAPGLYDNERKIIYPLLFISTLLFFIGMGFVYFVVFPLMFAFLTQTAPQGVAVMTDISSYLDFVLTLFFAFGLAFQVPVITLILIKAEVVKAESLTNKRPYIIIGAFLIGMLLTPPDVISQTLLAIPIWLLFECGLFAARWLPKKGDRQ